LKAAPPLRERLLTSAAFRRWASAFPLTRPFARRRARALFDLCAGFVYSQILAACLELRLFERLAAGPAGAGELAPALGLEAAAAERLMRAAAALELLSPASGGRYRLSSLGASLVNAPGIEAMVRHHEVLYRDLQDPVGLLRGTRTAALADYWGYGKAADAAAIPPAQSRAYSTLMDISHSMVAEQVLAAYSLGRHRRLLDLGGGEGGFLRAVAEAAPRLELMLMDLPAVAPVAARRLASAGLAGRSRVVAGDFFTDPLPEGADIISLNRVLHDHDDAAVRRLLGRVRAALPPGGTVLVAEPMAATPGAEPVGDAYFGLYLLALGSGRPRRRDELAGLLREAGFARIRPRRTPLPLQASVLTARRPAERKL